MPFSGSSEQCRMPVLKNQKWEQFAQAVALGMPAGQAYMECVSGGKCSEATAETTGPKLARESQIALRIAELRKGIGETVEKKFKLTKEAWLDRLVTIADKAEDAKDFSAAQNALDKVGKASAWYAPEEVNVTMGYEPPKKAMERLLGKGVDLGAILKLAGVTE